MIGRIVSLLFCLAFLGGGCGPDTVEDACRQVKPNASCCSDKDCGSNQFCHLEIFCDPIWGGSCKVNQGDFQCHERCFGSKCSNENEICISYVRLHSMSDTGIGFSGCFDPKDKNAPKQFK